MKKYLLEIGLGAILLCVVGVYGVFFISHPAKWSDFRAFYSGVQLWHEQPASLYDLEVQKEYQLRMVKPDEKSGTVLLPLINPPSFLLFYSWAIGMDQQLAYWIFGGVMASLYLVILLGLRQLFPVKHSGWLLLVSLSFAPIYATLFLGQSSVISLGVFTLIYLCLRDKRWWWAGLMTGLLAYKPQLMIGLGLYYLVTVRDWRLWAGLFVGGLGHVLVSWWMVPDFAPQLLGTIWFAFGQHGMGPELRVTWMGLVYQFLRWTGWSWWPMVGLGLSAATLAVMTWVVRDYRIGKKDWEVAFGLTIVSTLLGGIHAHYHDVLLMVLVAWLMIWRYGWNRWTMTGLITGWLVYMGASFTPMYPNPLPVLPTAFLAGVWICIVGSLLAKNGDMEN